MSGEKTFADDFDAEESMEETELCPICGENYMVLGEKMCEECKSKSEYEDDITDEEENNDPDKTDAWRTYLDDEEEEDIDLGIPDSEFEIEVDTVVISIGTSPNPLIKSTTEGLEVNAHGGIIVNEDGLSSRNAVYAGGDVVTGAATVISAMGAGKTAAKAIDEYITSK